MPSSSSSWVILGTIGAGSSYVTCASLFEKPNTPAELDPLSDASASGRPYAFII